MRGFPSICQRARKKAEMVAARRRIDPAETIDCAEGRLHADDPADRGRTKHRAANLAARCQRKHPRGDCCRGTRRGPAGRPLEVPGIPGRSWKSHGQFSRYRLAGDDRAAAPQCIDVCGVELRHIVCEQRTVAGGDEILDVEAILDADRHSVDCSTTVARPSSA